MVDILLVVLGLGGLYFGGDFLVRGSSRIAAGLGVTPLIIGLTIVAIGTSSPELFVSVGAAFNGVEGIALGNVIGSNIANIGLILGLIGVIAPIAVKEGLVRREIPLLIFITLMASLLILDGQLSRLDGVLLLAGFIGFNGLFYWLATRDDEEDIDIPGGDVDIPRDKSVKLPVEAVRVVFGIGLLVVGSNWLVSGATSIAQGLGVSDLVIGVTLVAFGTSLPELAASLTAAFRNEHDIAVGNVIGSNVANLLLVLGATTAIQPFDVGSTNLSVVEFVVMIGFTLLLLPFARNRKLSRWESAVFLGGYVAFIAYSFIANGTPPGA